MEQANYSPILINKPSGPTSFDIVARIRKITGIRKIGHTGTLDPLASGLLILLLGRARKHQDEFQGLDKEYVAEATLGAKTTTYDSEGELVQRCEQTILDRITEKVVAEKLQLFQGEQDQTVPPFSAVKVNGQKLYHQARKGQLDPKTLPKRKVTIYKATLLHFQKNTEGTLPKAKIRIFCSKGTYIRSVVHDLGEALGCGAYVSTLTRTKIGDYRLEDAITIEDFADKWERELKGQNSYLKPFELSIQDYCHFEPVEKSLN